MHCIEKGMGLTVALATLAATLSAPAPGSAGAWSQPKGHYYAKLSGIQYSSDEVYNDMGKRQSMGMDEESFDGSQVFLYAEYGLIERLTLIGQGTGGVLVSENRLVRSETTGLGDIDIGAKYQLLDRPLVLSPYLTFKVPTGYHGYYDPPMGTGKLDAEFRLLAARSLYPLPLYVGIEGGYRLRGGAFSNQIPYFAEIGATPHPKVFIKAFVDGKDTRVGTVEDLGLVGGSVQVSEGDYTKMGLNGAYNLYGSTWLDILVERTVRGENVGAGTSVGLGVSYSR